LPDGETKRAFIIDCTGCHQLTGRFAYAGERARTAPEWQAKIEQMLSFAGATAGFPIISADREAAATAAWLAAAIKSPPSPSGSGGTQAQATITEYDMPVARDLPHDLLVDADGKVVITGMFTHRMWTLDPTTRQFTSDSIPQPQSNPRAVEPGADGKRWVALGGPQRVAGHDPRSGRWEMHTIGMYPHSIGVDSAGKVWFNGHFTRDPELVGRVDPATGDVKTWTVPKHPSAVGNWGPIPYELRVAPDGRVWISELVGNRIVGFDPRTERFTVHTMPTPVSGPRRFDVDARGVLWIPAFAASKLVRFDPGTGQFKEYDLPVRDASPYVARVDARTGLIWIGTGAADAVFSFNPRSERFVTYPLPSRGALVRHLVVDSRRNAIWLAYGASPGEIPARVAKLEPR
jgi:virginiamycin B lyase